ncbi:MAG: hypothetical protein WBP54_06500 [Pelodictyon phaeoclathratiforme]
MAEYGEWTRKGATLTDVTALAEYGVDRTFILRGIRTGKLEYREGAVWGNPCLKVLKSQLEQFITEELGVNFLMQEKNQIELRSIKKEISTLKKRLDALLVRKKVIEQTITSCRANVEGAVPGIFPPELKE